ncbi:hypothetical protein BGX34_003158 [Mortierella sp. NVP85]|nr:hypothetical protein BGX34_003158 [Mortierella sp. NVP85]
MFSKLFKVLLAAAVVSQASATFCVEQGDHTCDMTQCEMEFFGISNGNNVATTLAVLNLVGSALRTASGAFTPQHCESRHATKNLLSTTTGVRTSANRLVSGMIVPPIKTRHLDNYRRLSLHQHLKMALLIL